jgi:hypothetical protein
VAHWTEQLECRIDELAELAAEGRPLFPSRRDPPPTKAAERLDITPDEYLPLEWRRAKYRKSKKAVAAAQRRLAAQAIHIANCANFPNSF